MFLVYRTAYPGSKTHELNQIFDSGPYMINIPTPNAALNHLMQAPFFGFRSKHVFFFMLSTKCFILEENPIEVGCPCPDRGMQGGC